MLVKEIVERAKLISNKLNIVDRIISNSLSNKDNSGFYNKLVNYKFDLLSKLRSHHILLDSLNMDTVIKVNDSELVIRDVLYLLDTIKEKIVTLDNILINDTNPDINVFDLLDKRDSLVEEYITLYISVCKSDCKVVWEGNK